jgi:hypothetical protein
MKRGLHQVFPKAAMKNAQSSFESPLKRGLHQVFPKAAMKSAQSFFALALKRGLHQVFPRHLNMAFLHPVL